MPWSRPRLSIAALMGLVLFSAVAFAALRDGSDVWAASLFSALLLACGVAALTAAFGRGRRRATAAGFSAFGLVYATLAFAPGFADTTRPRLIPAIASRALYVRLHGDDVSARLLGAVRLWDVSSGRPLNRTVVTNGGTARSIAFSPDGRLLASTSGGLTQAVTTFRGVPGLRSAETFEDVVHALAGLLMAALGGLIARRLQAPRASVARP